MHHLDPAGYNISSAISCILPLAQKVYTGDEDGRVVGLLQKSPRTGTDSEDAVRMALHTATMTWIFRFSQLCSDDISLATISIVIFINLLLLVLLIDFLPLRNRLLPSLPRSIPLLIQ